VVTKKFLPRFNYDKSKVEEYQLALVASLGNLWVVNSIGHLGGDKLVDLLQQCVGATTKSTFGNKPSGGSCRKRHCHKPWFDVDCRTTKRELRLWLKANPDSHVAKHQESKLKKLLKRKRLFGKLQELNICVRLLRWMHFCSGKNTGQRHPLWPRSMQLRFWRAFAP
jgi:hypothetical protein